MARIACSSAEEATNPRGSLVVLGPQHHQVRERHNAERMAAGRLYIPDDVDLSKDILTWINRLEDSLGWDICASSGQFSRLIPSIKNRGANA